MALWRAYEKEETLFVRSSYLIAMQKLDMMAFLKPIKARLKELSEMEVEENNKKHIGKTDMLFSMFCCQCDKLFYIVGLDFRHVR